MNILRNTNRRPTAASRSRDLGIRGAGPGKGSAPRNNFSAEFRRNYSEIFVPGSLGEFGDHRASEDPTFTRVKGNRYRKVFR